MPIAAALFLAMVLAGGGARAGGPPTDAEIAKARERFAEGRKLEDAGRWAEALSMFQRVAEVKITPQVRFHIALCMENVGLWTQALDGFQRAAAEAGTSAPDVVQEANQHTRKLAAAMPTVTLVASGAEAGDEVFLDRRRVAHDDLPLPIRTDPGPHVVEVRHRGTVVARRYFALAPRDTTRVELRVGDVAPEIAPSTLEPGVPGAVGPRAGGDAGGAPSEPGHVQRILGWTAVGLGGASAVVAGVFIGLRADARNRLDEACPGLTQCARSVSDIVADGKRSATLVNVFAVAGGVAAAAGVVIVLTAPSAPSAGPPTAFTLRATPGGLSLSGAF